VSYKARYPALKADLSGFSSILLQKNNKTSFVAKKHKTLLANSAFALAYFHNLHEVNTPL
jgi:hypothetical protein